MCAANQNRLGNTAVRDWYLFREICLIVDIFDLVFASDVDLVQPLLGIVGVRLRVVAPLPADDLLRQVEPLVHHRQRRNRDPDPASRNVELFDTLKYNHKGYSQMTSQNF